MTIDAQTLARPVVAVVGGGYGGTAVAKALDQTADVVLVEPREAFVHNVASLRALVDPSWLPRIFLPYDGLLERGRVVRDRAALVEPESVVTASGDEIAADYVVLASGSAYPFPAKAEEAGTQAAHDRVRRAHRVLAEAERVLLLGAGPVGIELAGEIHHRWPGTSITLLDVGGEILAGPFLPELRAELRRQLDEAGVRVVLGSPLRQPPPTAPGEPGTFTVTTEAGVEVSADVWFRCYGVSPNSDYLGASLRGARRADGFVEVLPTLQVRGQDTVFALGDVSTADAKMAGFAGRQAETVAANISALAAGRRDLSHYESTGPAIAVPIGPQGGAGQLPGREGIVGPDVVAELKGRHLLVDRMAARFGLPAGAR